jgi:hypothetical protein
LRSVGITFTITENESNVNVTGQRKDVDGIDHVVNIDAADIFKTCVCPLIVSVCENANRCPPPESAPV